MDDAIARVQADRRAAIDELGDDDERHGAGPGLHLNARQGARRRCAGTAAGRRPHAPAELGEAPDRLQRLVAERHRRGDVDLRVERHAQGLGHLDGELVRVLEIAIVLGLDRVAEAVGQALELLHDPGDALEVGEAEEGVHDVHVGQRVADDLHLGVLAQGGRPQLPCLGVDVAHAHALQEVHAVAADAHVHGAVARDDLVARRYRASDTPRRGPAGCAPDPSRGRRGSRPPRGGACVFARDGCWRHRSRGSRGRPGGWPRARAR